MVRQLDKEPIAPVITDEVKKSMDLLEKMDRGEINADELEVALTAGDKSVVEKPQKEIKEQKSYDEIKLKDNIELDDVVEPDENNDIEDLIDEPIKPIAKSKRKRDRQKENMLLDQMRIEQLEIEKQELAQQLNVIRQQQSQQQQWIDQSNRQYQDSVTAASIGRIDQLERELVEAASLYDNPRVAKINAELVRLRVEQEWAKLRPTQQNSQPQINPRYNPQQQVQVTPEEAMVQHRILEFCGRPQNKWTDLEFAPGAIPKTEDALKLVNIINEIKAERGDWRTPSFWDIVEERASEVLPHKYGGIDSPKAKSPPVGMSANKGTVTTGKTSYDSVDVEVVNIMKQAMSGPGGLRFKTREEQQSFIRDLKGQLKKRSL